jgi:hypothetical protein
MTRSLLSSKGSALAHCTLSTALAAIDQALGQTDSGSDSGGPGAASAASEGPPYQNAGDANLGAPESHRSTIPGDIVDEFAEITDGIMALSGNAADFAPGQPELDAVRVLAYCLHDKIENFAKKLEAGRAQP